MNIEELYDIWRLAGKYDEVVGITGHGKERKQELIEKFYQWIRNADKQPTEVVQLAIYRKRSSVLDMFEDN